MVFHMEPRRYAEQVARNVAAAIAGAGLTQRDVADATGIALPTLNRRLKGSGRSFDVAELAMIAPVVEVPVETLTAVA